MRYSKNLQIIGNVLKNSKDALLAVGTLAVGYILISALVILNVEPESFNNFFDAVYWATISLTTMGYGDIYPVTTFGRIVTMLSSLVGIAIVALPAGIITAGYMSALQEEEEEEAQEGKAQDEKPQNDKVRDEAADGEELPDKKE
jgi:voltage-gated potassium channel